MLSHPLLHPTNTLESHEQTNEMDASVHSPRHRQRQASASAPIVNKVKRPLNAFFLYRADKRAEFSAKYGPIKNQEMSKIVSQHWRNEPIEVRKKYEQLAAAKYQEHFEKNPDFVWMPKYRGQENRAARRADETGRVPPTSGTFHACTVHKRSSTTKKRSTKSTAKDQQADSSAWGSPQICYLPSDSPAISESASPALSLFKPTIGNIPEPTLVIDQTGLVPAQNDECDDLISPNTFISQVGSVFETSIDQAVHAATIVSQSLSASNDTSASDSIPNDETPQLSNASFDASAMPAANLHSCQAIHVHATTLSHIPAPSAFSFSPAFTSPYVMHDPIQTQNGISVNTFAPSLIDAVCTDLPMAQTTSAPAICTYIPPIAEHDVGFLQAHTNFVFDTVSQQVPLAQASTMTAHNIQISVMEPENAGENDTSYMITSPLDTSAPAFAWQDTSKTLNTSAKYLQPQPETLGSDGTPFKSASDLNASGSKKPALRVSTDKTSSRFIPAPINTKQTLAQINGSAPSQASAKLKPHQGPVTDDDISRLVESFWKLPSPLTPLRTPLKSLFSFPPLFSSNP